LTAAADSRYHALASPDTGPLGPGRRAKAAKTN